MGLVAPLVATEVALGVATRTGQIIVGAVLALGKLFIDAQMSMGVPSTEKRSVVNSPLTADRL